MCELSRNWGIIWSMSVKSVGIAAMVVGSLIKPAGVGPGFAVVQQETAQ